MYCICGADLLFLESQCREFSEQLYLYFLKTSNFLSYENFFKTVQAEIE